MKTIQNNDEVLGAPGTEPRLTIASICRPALCGWRYPSMVYAISFLLLLLLANPVMAIRPGLGFAPPSARDGFRLPLIEGEEAHDLNWSRNLDEALAEAALEQQSVVVLITARGCPYSRQLKQDVLQHRDVVLPLQRFVRVEMDATRDGATLAAYRVRHVPTLLILAADGRELHRISGAVSADALAVVLRSLLEEQRAVQTESAEDDWLEWLSGDSLTRDQWRSVLGRLHVERVRNAVRQHLLQADPFPSSLLVELLEDSRLAVRLAALEVLEERTGDDFGFDPWQPSDLSQPSLERWRRWATGDPGAAGSAVVYAVLTTEQVERYVRDMMSDQRTRSLRATQLLIRGGPSILPLLDSFVAQHPDLPPGILNRLREIRYAILLQDQDVLDAASWAQRLVFGHQDARLQALRELAPYAMQALPILEDHLRMEDPLIRETAIETLLIGGGPRSVSLLRAHAAEETDVDVLIALLRGVSRLRSNRSVRLLMHYLQHENEDVVITSLQGIQRLRARIAEDAVVERLADPRWRVRVAALDAAGALRTQKAVPYFEDLFHDEEEFVRFKAVQVVGLIEPETGTRLLEDLFWRDDRLKGPVIAAFCSMDRNPPSSFIAGFAGPPPDVLLSITEALSGCSGRGVRLAAPLAFYPNPDVALSALRVLGQYGLNDGRHRGVLLDALESGDPLRVATALEAMSQAHQFWTPTGLGAQVLGIFQDLLPGVDDEYDDNLQDLFDAFLSPEELVGPVPAPDAASDVDDIVGLFMDELDGGTPDAQDTRSRVAGRTDLLKAIELFLDHEDAGIRYHAGLIFVRAREPRVLLRLHRDLDGLTVGQRTELARLLVDWHSNEVLQILGLLLRDPADQVRAAAVNAILRARNETEWLNLLLEVLEEPNTRLDPAHFMVWPLRSLLQRPASRVHLRTQASRLLDHREPRIKALGIVLLDGLWRSNDQEVLLPFLDAWDPYLRRAAARAVGRNQPRALVPFLNVLANDGSEHVREVLPGLMHAGAGWTHRFAPDSYGRDYFRDHDDVWSRLTADQRQQWVDAVRSLIRDPSPEIRLAAGLALASRGESIEVPVLMAALQLVPEESGTINRISQFMDQSLPHLDSSFAPLLAYVGQSSLTATKQDRIRSHFDAQSDERAVIPVEYRVRQADVVEAIDDDAGEEPVENVDLDPVRLIFFEDPGCPDCEMVKAFLDVLLEWYPEIYVERHSLSTARGLNLNEEYAEQFDAPVAWRSITPAIVGAAGFLAGDAITYDALEDLIVRSMGIPDGEWHLDARPVVSELLDDAAVPDSELVADGEWAKYAGVIAVISVLVGVTWSVVVLRRRIRVELR